MDDRVQQPQPTGVEKFAAAVQKENARRISFDWRIPVPSVFAFVVGGICSASGLIYYAGGVRQSFADSVEKVAIHEIRIGALEGEIAKTNLDVSDMRGDIKQILALLREPVNRGPH